MGAGGLVEPRLVQFAGFLNFPQKAVLLTQVQTLCCCIPTTVMSVILKSLSHARHASVVSLPSFMVYCPFFTGNVNKAVLLMYFPICCHYYRTENHAGFFFPEHSSIQRSSGPRHLNSCWLTWSGDWPGYLLSLPANSSLCSLLLCISVQQLPKEECNKHPEGEDLQHCILRLWWCCVYWCINWYPGCSV